MWILEEEFPSDVSLLLSNAASGDLSQGIHNVEPIPMFPRPVSRSSGDVLVTNNPYLVRLLRLLTVCYDFVRHPNDSKQLLEVA